MPGSVLIIEDMLSLQELYQTLLQRAGFATQTAASAREGAKQFAAQKPDVVLLDLLLPDRDGLDLMAEMIAQDDRVRVIVITAHGSINRAVGAMRAGAFDFLVKPFDDQRLIASVRNALADLGATATAGRATRILDSGLEGMIGTSAPMQAIFDKIEAISRSVATIFLTGENGTGKEMCARSIHRLSNRADGPFVTLNCVSMGEGDEACDVFAVEDASDAIARADGGTLFLNEICEMDLALQGRFLRFLETSVLDQRTGGSAAKYDVRIVCGCSRDPERELTEGRFREDLYYRLHVVPLHLPPLRSRGDDVIHIANWALQKYSEEEGKAFDALGRDVKQVFARHPWPGNVRQLLNTIRNVVVINDGPSVELSMLGGEFLAALNETPRKEGGQRLSADPPVNGAMLNFDAAVSSLANSGKTLAELERGLIEAVIRHHEGSVPRAAKHLDLSPSTIYRKRETWD